MRTFLNIISMPLVLVGAVNYGLIAIRGQDILRLLGNTLFIKIAQVSIAVAGIWVVMNIFTRNND